MGAAIEILNKQIPLSHVRQHAFQQRVELVRREGLVHAPPFHRVVRNRIVHGEFVSGTAARPSPRRGYQRAIGRQSGLAAQQSALYKLRRRQVLVHLGAGRQRPNRFRY
jgi:hypothetical protein